MTAQLWKLGDRGDARLTFECPWCDVVGSSPVLAVHEARDAYWLFAACPVPACGRGVMVRVSHAIAGAGWLGVDTGNAGLLLDRTCVIPAARRKRPHGTWYLGVEHVPGARYARGMQSGPFDEEQFFRAIAESGARVLLIGRRALIVLGIPVLTADYDFWIHRDDAPRLNQALEPMGLVPNRSPAAAREVGRYVLENDERVDVLVARSVATVDGVQVAFDDVWGRRQEIELFAGVSIALPSIDDLIATKRFGARPRDVDDVRLLQAFKAREQP